MPEDSKAIYSFFDYSDAPTLAKFAMSNKRVRCVMGPFGCIDGDTKVFTTIGLVRISDIDRPMHILTWNAKKDQFQLSLSGGAFPKGRDYLYRISTPQGEFAAAEHHLVFCADNKYRQVRDLRQGDVLVGCSEVQRAKLTLRGLLSLPEDDLCFDRKLVDLMDHYAKSARQDGQQLLQEEEPCRVSFQEQDGARRLSGHFGSDVSVLKDVPLGQSQGHIHPDQFGDQKRIDGFYHKVVRHDGVAEDRASLQPFPRNAFQLQQSLQFPLKKAYHYIKKLLTLCFHSLSTSSLSEWAILSIKREDVKRIFWDMQVLGTNNYVTEDWTIHHNSGKSSACVMEIFRRANEQIKGPDGIRRSRWVVVRNSYIQLRDTTIKTFHDWFPPKLCGEWRVTDHTYLFTKFPGIHLEVLFRALDRPDQVSNLLSLELTGAWFNEVREIPKPIVDAMDSRIGRYPSKRDGGSSWHGIIMDTNPPDETSWLYKVFERVQPDDWQIFKQPSGLSSYAENLKNLPKNYYTNLIKGKDEMYIRVYINGQYGYIISGKPVFQSFVDNVHVSPRVLEPQKGLDLLIGFDFALQPTCVMGQITPLGQLRILDELLSDGMGLQQFCANILLPRLRQKYFGYNVVGFGDPSGTSRSPTDESTCFDILHSHEVGLNYVEPAPTNAIIPRVSAVEGFLNKMWKGEPGFLLSPSCTNLRRAMNGAYHYEKDPKGYGSEEYKPMPAKNYASHVADALQMLCMYVTEKNERDKRHKSFLSQMGKRDYRPASIEAGY